MTSPLRVLALSGSLRKSSYNSALLRAAQQLAPAGVTVDLFDLRPIPMYDDDLRTGGWPEPVAQLRSAIAAADALLIGTPEYNYSLPAVLKNALDWASRAPDAPLTGKPAAIMSATMGNLGGIRAQVHLRQVLVGTGTLAVNRPEVAISRVQERFDAGLGLTDEPTRKLIEGLLVSLAAWTLQLRSHG
jgi:chromate reductase